MQHRILLFTLLLSLLTTQAEAASVNSALRITATSLQGSQYAQAIELDDDDKDDGNPNRMASTAIGVAGNLFEQRIQLSPGHLYRVWLEGDSDNQWVISFDPNDILIIRRDAHAAPLNYRINRDNSSILTVAISY